MDDIEYILKIVLRARDEMAAVLMKARTQIRGFARDADKMNTSVTNLNQAMKNFDGHLEGITKKLENWRAVVRDAGDENKKTAKSVDELGKSADKTSKATRQMTETQKQLQDRARAIRKEFNEVQEARRKDHISAELAAKKYKEFARQLEEVSLRMSKAARERTPAHHWAQDMQEAAAKIHELEKQITEDMKRGENERAKAAADHEALIKRVYKEHADAAVRTYQAEQAASAESARQTKKDAEAHEALVRRVYKEHADAAVRAYQEETKAAETTAKRNEELERRSALQRERLRQRREGGSPAEVRALAAGYDRLSRSYETGSHEARIYGNEAERLRATLRSTTRETERHEGALSRLSRRFNNSGGSLSGFDNKLRGIGFFAAVVAIDQLISSVIALGGELVSLAGSAVMAGGALGGALAAGAAQALPVIGLLAGAAQRVKSVFQAFQQAQALQKAQATDAEKGSQKALDKSNALTNAQDAQKDAQDRLAESRKALNQANKDGVDQLEDLIYAEKSAALAARGASLNVKEAQKALQDAIRGGASALDIQGRQQALDEARLSQGRSVVTARRATRERRAAGGKVENLESVQSAAKAVDDAQDALEKANRQLDLAADKADRVASSTMTAAANLNYLLSQLSPAERRLYEAFSAMYENYKRIFQGTSEKDGIYGVIVDSFTRAVTRVNEIIQMPDVINTIQSLSNEIAKQIDKIVGSFTTPKGIDQLQRIIKDAGENLGPVVDMAVQLGHAFLDIAEAANPALQDLLKYLGGVVDKFVGLTGDSDKLEKFFSDGEEHLESWLDLLLAVLGLFAALTGASAESGQRSIEDLTKKIKEWTDWIDDHHDQVVAFFEEARKASYKLFGVVENLVKMLGRSFSAERVENFADILNTIVIPALEDVIDWLGKITDFIANAIEDETVAKWVRFGIALFLFSKAASFITGIFGKLLGVFAKIEKILGPVSKLLLRLTGQGGIRGFMLLLGPWGALVVAVVAGVVLLLHHFGRLDDVWKGIKDTFKSFMEDIQPAIDRLKEAIKGIGVDGDTLKKIWEGIQVAGQFLADFIAKYLVEQIKAAGKILSGVFNSLISTIAGIIKIIHGFVDIIDGLFHWDKEKMSKGVHEVLDGITDIIKGWIDGIILVFEGLVKGAMSPFQALWDAIKNALKLGDLTDALLGAFKDAWNAVLDFFGVHSPSRLAMDLGEAIIDGLKAGLRAARRIFTEPGKLAWRGFKAAFNGADDFGEWVLKTFVKGLKRIGNLIADAAKFLWGKFRDAFPDVAAFGERMARRIVNGIRTLPAKMAEAVKTMASDLVNIGKSIGDAIWNGIKSAFGGVVDIAKGLADKTIGFIKGLLPGGDDDKKKAAPAQRPAGGADVGAGVIPFGAKDLETAQKMYADFWKGMGRSAQTSTDVIKREFRDMRIASTQSTAKMYLDIRSSLADIQKSFDVRGKTIVKSWGDDWFSLMKVTHEGLNYIGHETNQALKALGEKSIAFKLSEPSKKDGKAVGGWIGQQGERGKDRGFYPLGAGEAVLNWAHQRYVEPAMNAFYGHGLGEMFSRTTAYHAGGPEQPGFAAGTPGGGHAEVGNTGRWVANTQLARTVLSLMRRYKFAITAAGEQGHASNSDHHWGGALDLVPGPGGSWSDLDKLAHAAGWKPNQPMPAKGPFRWIGWNTESGHGSGNHLHLSWRREGPFSGPGGSGGGVVEEIARRVVTPRATATAKIVQAAIDTVLKAANQKVSESGGGDQEASTPTGKGVLTKSQVQNVIRNALDILKITKDTGKWVQTLTRQAQRESGFRPDAVNDWDINAQRGDPSKGLIQIIGSNFNRYKVKGHNNILNALDNVLAVINYTIDRYGSGNASKAVETLWARGGGAYAKGGPIPGQDGAAVPILAHAGEWVLNKGQQARAAMLSGLSPAGLKAMLGFGGGPASFARGGEVLLVGDSLGKGIEEAIKKAFKNAVTSTEVGISSAATVERLKDNYKRAFRSVIFDAGTNDAQASVFGKNLKKAYKLLHQDQELIVPTLKGGPQAAAKNKLLRAFAKGKENVEVVDTTDIPLGGDRLHPAAGGYSRIAGRVSQAVRSGVTAAAGISGAPTKADPYRVAPITTTKTLMDDVADTWKGITEIAKIMKKVKTDKIKKGDANKVGTAYQETIGLIDNIIGPAGIGEIANQIQKHIGRAATALKKATYQIGAGGVVKRVLSPGGVLDSELATMTTTTHELVDEKGVIVDSLKQVNKQIKKVTDDKTITETRRKKLLQQLETQRNDLLDEQDRIDTEIRDSIEARFQKQLEIQQNAVDEINKRFERGGKALDLAKRIATAYGNTDIIGSLNQQIADNMNRQIGELEGRIGAARAAGATDLATQLEDQIAELRVQVLEATMQMIRDAADSVSQAAGRERTKLDLFGRMADALGVVGQTAAAAIPGLGGMSRAEIAQGRVSADITERAGLTAVRDRAAQAGNIGLVQELTDKINELTVTIAENTKAAFDARIAAVTTAHDYDQSILDLRLQLVDLDGTIAGNTDMAEKARLLGLKNTDLLAKGHELSDLLLEATPGTQTYKDLEKAILENEVATKQNTIALNEVTGAGSTPSTFSSTAWQWFRSAFLTGTGAVMPQYIPPTNAATIGDMSSASSTTTTNNSNGNTFVTTVQVNEVEGPTDPNKIAGTVVYAQATASR